MPSLTARQLAQRWEEANIYAAGEEIVAFLLDNNWAIKLKRPPMKRRHIEEQELDSQRTIYAEPMLSVFPSLATQKSSRAATTTVRWTPSTD